MYKEFGISEALKTLNESKKPIQSHKRPVREAKDRNRYTILAYETKRDADKDRLSYEKPVATKKDGLNWLIKNKDNYYYILISDSEDEDGMGPYMSERDHISSGRYSAQDPNDPDGPDEVVTYLN